MNDNTSTAVEVDAIIHCEPIESQPDADINIRTICKQCDGPCPLIGDICDICTRVSNIRRHRHQSGQAMENQANKMVVRSNRILRPVDIGDSVLVPIPSVDRGRGDPRNLLCYVLEENDGHFKLGTKHGVLNLNFSRSQFTPTSCEGLRREDIKEDLVLSVREAAREQSIADGQGFVKCSCKTGCKTKSCKCLKNSVLCNSRCHNSLSCKNK